MAEVIDHWPSSRKPAAQQFVYPWDQWATLDDQGVGDIWLATQGIDFPASMSPLRFRGALYNRCDRATNKRIKAAPMVLKRVTVRNTRTGVVSEKVKKVPDYRILRVKAKVVSDEQVAFQFYDCPESPPEPEVTRVVVPQRRKPLRQPVTRRVLERV